MRSRPASGGSPCWRLPPWPGKRLQTCSRASSSPIRLDWVPPLVKTPSAWLPRPMRAQVQSIRRCSISVPPALWSQVSSEELNDDTSTSASSAGSTTGQLRWAT